MSQIWPTFPTMSSSARATSSPRCHQRMPGPTTRLRVSHAGDDEMMTKIIQRGDDDACHAFLTTMPTVSVKVTANPMLTVPGNRQMEATCTHYKHPLNAHTGKSGCIRVSRVQAHDFPRAVPCRDSHKLARQGPVYSAPKQHVACPADQALTSRVCLTKLCKGRACSSRSCGHNNG